MNLSRISYFLMVCFSVSHPSWTKTQVPTSLKIQVMDTSKQPVAAAEVVLYITEENYRYQKNAFAKGETDKNGRVTFRRLKPVPYFIDARNELKKNDGLAAMTDSLQKNKINKVVVLIE
ncbi:hypothetical protein N8385_00515 [Cyclobacteriaceae bacterium]|jgi:hypothetical protein|nr:hypothetical protein [Cyclobacteriaceae bacterium]